MGSDLAYGSLVGVIQAQAQTIAEMHQLIATIRVEIDRMARRVVELDQRHDSADDGYHSLPANRDWQTVSSGSDPKQVVALRAIEKAIIQTLTDAGRPLKGSVIARRLGRRATSHFWHALRCLVMRGIALKTAEKVYRLATSAAPVATANHSTPL